jgi:hypothetical protein
MIAENQNTFRIPQNLEKFKAAGTITTEIIKNPHKVLENAIKGLNITETITFEVSSGPPTAELNGGGTANISFLAGKQDPVTINAPRDKDFPIAHADFMKAKYWIEVVLADRELELWTAKSGLVDLATRQCSDARSNGPTTVSDVWMKKSDRLNQRHDHVARGSWRGSVRT